MIRFLIARRRDINMQITDKARDSLMQVLQEQNTAGIRVYFAGIS
jgi:hypothetical protein